MHLNDVLDDVLTAVDEIKIKKQTSEQKKTTSNVVYHCIE